MLYNITTLDWLQIKQIPFCRQLYCLLSKNCLVLLYVLYFASYFNKPRGFVLFGVNHFPHHLYYVIILTMRIKMNGSIIQHMTTTAIRQKWLTWTFTDIALKKKKNRNFFTLLRVQRWSQALCNVCSITSEFTLICKLIMKELCVVKILVDCKISVMVY